MAKGSLKRIVCRLLVSLCAAACALLCACSADGGAAVEADLADRTEFAEDVDDRPPIEGDEGDLEIRSDDPNVVGGIGSMIHKASGVVESVDRENEIVVVSVASGSEYVLGQTITFDFSKHQGPIYEIDKVAEGDTVNVEFQYGPGQNGMWGGEVLEVA